MQRIYTTEIENKNGESVKLAGWVKARRDHGKLIFIDLEDKKGQAQVVFSPSESELHKQAKSLREEWVVEIEGEVTDRPENMQNPDLETGKVEVKAKKLQVFSQAKPLPFSVKDEGYQITEEKRLKYRYLDLRRQRMKKNLKTRQKVINYIRNFLIEREFIEIETPLLTKSTPEGARDFLVPSRMHPGNFYALPQSPQQYKQLLMVAGFEKYFQFPHVFRDEDLRSNRLSELVQIDLEMAFTSEEEVRNLIEEMITGIIEKVLRKKIQDKPFPVISYQEAIEKYGEDDPDIRKDKSDKNIIAPAWVKDFPMFEEREDGSIGAQHHPFTKIKEEQIPQLDKMIKGEMNSIREIKANQYDLVLNGYEAFGGSIREHRPEILQKVFQVMGHNEKEIQEKFGHLLEAFSYGVPPHGGIAGGLERLLQALLGEKNIRETQAFPTTTSGKTAVMDAPSPVSEEQLKELGIKIRKNN